MCRTGAEADCVCLSVPKKGCQVFWTLRGGISLNALCLPLPVWSRHRPFSLRSATNTRGLRARLNNTVFRAIQEKLIHCDTAPPFSLCFPYKVKTYLVQKDVLSLALISKSRAQTAYSCRKTLPSLVFAVSTPSGRITKVLSFFFFFFSV